MHRAVGISKKLYFPTCSSDWDLELAFFYYLLILVISFNIWLSVNRQIQVPISTAGNHPTFFRNSNSSEYA